MKVLITAPWVNQYANELRASFPAVEFIDGQKPEDALRNAAEAEIIFGTVTSELLAATAKLRWIGFPAAGVEWMQHVPVLLESDVAVTNAARCARHHHCRTHDGHARLFGARF